jgi:plastocyanin
MMQKHNALRVSLMVMVGLAGGRAADIEGSITIKRRLTKLKVTIPASSYDRGVAVELPPDPLQDVLALERSRVVIYLEGDFPSEPLQGVMEQKNRQFVSDTLVLPVGSTVSFPNLDPIFHNVFSLSRAKAFDLGNYSKDHTRTVTFSKPGIVSVYCHLHANMAGVIVITPNQWNAKADGSGRFLLTGVPRGSYTITAWHRAAGFFRQTVKVAQDRAAAVHFDIPLDALEAAPTVVRR